MLLLANLDAFDPRLHLSLCRAVETHGAALPIGEGDSVFPADFILVATVKPCPCGLYDDPIQGCFCTADAIVDFRRRLREVIETCFDLQVEVPLLRRASWSHARRRLWPAPQPGWRWRVRGSTRGTQRSRTCG